MSSIFANLEMFRFVLFAVFAGSFAGPISVYFENAHYRGHFLSVNGTSLSTAAIRNPPVSDVHRWVLDWELMFRPQGSNISSYFTKTFITTTPLEAEPLKLGTTSAAMKMSHRVVNNKYLYKIEMMTGTPTPTTVMGCLFDTGLQINPIITATSNCTNENLRAWWNIYTA